MPPPRERGAPPPPQDDWVSCVAPLVRGPAASADRLATGCYDGVVRLWEAGAGLAGDGDGAAEAEGGGDGAAAAAAPKKPAVELAGAFFAHRGGVTGAVGAGAGLLVTCGKDHRARLWRLVESSERGEAAARGGSRRGGARQQQQQQQPEAAVAIEIAELSAHTDTVEALAVGPGGDRCATGGWDGALHVWRSGRALERAAADEPAGAATPERGGGGGGAKGAAASKKRRVGGEDGDDAGEGGSRRTAPLSERPLARLDLPSSSSSSPAGAAAAQAGGGAGGHCVSALAWPSRACLYSGGYDHSVRRWDVERGAAVASCPTSRPVLSLAAPAPLVFAAAAGAEEDEEGDGEVGLQGGHVVVFGSADGVLRLWDARAGPQVALATPAGAQADDDGGEQGQQQGAAAAKAVGGNAGGAWTSCVAWRPGSLHHVAAASHDGSARLFDLRTALPLGTLAGLHGGGKAGGGGGGGGGKALCVAWWRGGGGGGEGTSGGVPRFLASGGTDCRLRVSALPAGCGDGIL